LTSYLGAVENWRVGADEYTEDFPNHNFLMNMYNVYVRFSCLMKHFGIACFHFTDIQKE
jgi:hypothetical protein